MNHKGISPSEAQSLTRWAICGALTLGCSVAAGREPTIQAFLLIIGLFSLLHMAWLAFCILIRTLTDIADATRESPCEEDEGDETSIIT